MKDYVASYDAVHEVFEKLFDAYHPDGVEEDDVDPNFKAVFVLFLTTVGWSEDDFWDAFESEAENGCDCSECDCEGCDKPDDGDLN